MIAETEKTKAEPTHFLEALSLFAIFVSICLYAISVLQVYSIPYGLDFGEGYLANVSIELLHGMNPYHSLTGPPWIVTFTHLYFPY